MSDSQHELDFKAELAEVLRATDTAEVSLYLSDNEELYKDVNYGDDEYASN